MGISFNPFQGFIRVFTKRRHFARLELWIVLIPSRDLLGFSPIRIKE